MIIDRTKITKMMNLYLQTKEQNKDALLFYQLGDFYEMFFDDAIIASKVLDLTLTGKDCGLDERAPMCGIPVHALDNYLPKLVGAGYKVAICNQIGDINPKTKELVKREIIKIVTPGTLTDSIDATRNNYIMSIAVKGVKFGCSYADITTGKLVGIKLNSIKELEDTLVRVRPAEIIVNQEAKMLEPHIQSIRLNVVPSFYAYHERSFNFETAEKLTKTQLKVNSLKVFDVTEEHTEVVMSLGALFSYLNETQKRTLNNLNNLHLEKPKNMMHLDSNTRKNLELTENMTTRKKKGSLLGLLDKTKTSMGARYIRTLIEEPITMQNVINARLDGVEELYNNKMLCDDIIQVLSSLSDIERITGKIAYGTVSPKECVSLKDSLLQVAKLKAITKNTLTSIIFTDAVNNLGNYDKLINLLNNAIVDVPPNNLKDGGYIKPEFNQDLNDFYNAKKLGKLWLAELENKLKEETGIKTLKVSYNRVFGYYIEVSKLQSNLAPTSWIRRQTTVNTERFINEELKQMEDKILNSEQNALKLEAEIFLEIKNTLKTQIELLQKTSNAVATIDVLLSLATVAYQNNYVRPVINNSINQIKIIDGRHPVIESILQSGDFIPNDTVLNANDDRTMIITGPNMAGKSTYMRQVAIITLMAHIGSFVPAKSAEISITDRIFTRIGASDELAFGQSTFMVEMTEVANILSNATNNSLVILDEIGRGTSTYDGLSIAWSVVEYLSHHLTCKTLFATHYHELTDLEGKLAGVKNYRVLIKELNNDVVFLHKIVRGSANKSFGIEVAKLAGLPLEIVNRAKEILAIQEAENSKSAINSYDPKIITSSKTKENVNIAEVLNVLSDLDMNTVSPLVAFSTLQNLVDKVKEQ